MHRTIEASISPDVTDVIIRDLERNPCVIGLNVLRSASVKPKGDTLLIHVLNRGADEVLRTIRNHVPNDSYSIVTSEVASMNDPKHQREIDHDIDEAIWEEMETGLRHNGRLTTNYLSLMALGGIIASVGFVSTVHHLTIAFVAASVIAPGLEPLAKIPLGIALRRWDVAWVGIKASVVGYGILTLFAALTFRLLLLIQENYAAAFLEQEALHSLIDWKLKDLIVSIAAASASILMYLAYRRNVIAGPLIALVLIPAMAALGMSLAIGEWGHAGEIMKRMGLEVLFVIGIGLVLIFAKQKFVHRREPLR